MVEPAAPSVPDFDPSDLDFDPSVFAFDPSDSDDEPESLLSVVFEELERESLR